MLQIACWALGEIGSRVDIHHISGLLSRILQALGVCLSDDSWQVRGAACVSTGNVIEAYPEECGEVSLSLLLPLWIAHLGDHVATIRRDAATAIGYALRLFSGMRRQVVLDTVLRHLRSQFLIADTELQKSKRQFSFIPQNSPLYEVANRHHQLKYNPPPLNGSSEPPIAFDLLGVNDTSIINAMGSSAMPSRVVTSPKIRLNKRPGSWGCCMDCKSTEERKPWEAYEGIVLLLKELSESQSETAADFLPV